MTPRKPKSAQAHGPAGRALVEAITAQLAADGLAPDARDQALLEVAGHLADRIVELEEMVVLDGARTISAAGVIRLHPAVAEARNTAVSMSKVLAAVALAETTGAAKDPNKVRAAETRWRAHNLAKEAERAAAATGAVRSEKTGA